MWFSAMDVNFNVVFFLSRAVLLHMKRRGGGSIVNTSSVWELGRDCTPLGIRVNAVCPHEINTLMIRSGFERRGLDPDKAIEEQNKTVPLGRIAELEDIADVIAFLASDKTRYIAGETVEVAGAKPVSG